LAPKLLDVIPVPVYRIPIEQIAVIDRGRKDYGSLEDLVESIKSNGQITPGTVRRAVESDADEGVDDSKTPWVLVAGGRRFAACALAGCDTFKAEDYGEIPELRRRVVELEENLHRKELEWFEEDAMRKEIHELRKLEAAEAGEKWGLADTAQVLGEGINTVSRALRVAEAIEADPTLRGAGSRKAAIRTIEFREHLARQELKLGRDLTKNLRTSVVTADAADWLRKQGTASIDLFLSDFPYAYDYHSLARKDSPSTYSTDYDDTPEVNFDLFIDIVPEIIRATKPTGWLVIFMAESNQPMLRELFESCCATHYTYGPVRYEREGEEWVKVMPTECDHKLFAPNANSLEPCKFLRAEVPSWIWFRPNSRNPGRLPERHAKNFYEPILVFNRGEGRLYKHQDECPNVLVYDAEYGSERIHANQKPRPLAMELVQRFTLPGEKVVDSFFGSGNLLAGAAEVHRIIAGCDSAPLMLEPALANISNYYNG
jgi:ParB/RepB/Spo0J family partition protein